METERQEPRLADQAAPAILLRLEGVEKRYGAFRPALMGIEMTVARGEFVLVHGPGGAGKSVLLRLLAGLEAPTAGSVRIADEEMARMRPRARALLRRSMGVLPPGGALLPGRSVLDNVALAAWVAGTGHDEGLRRARAALGLVGVDVDTQGDVPCRQLGGGQRQCVALARALVNRPALLVLDDPLAGLDEAAAARVLGVLGQFSEAGVTVVASARAVPAGAVPVGAPWPASALRLRLQDGKIAA
jgi:cell division transport system ATP-binding protein